MSDCKSTSLSLLDLPAEVRNYIYDLSIVPTRLSRFSIQDPDYIFNSVRLNSCVPAFLSTCRRVYNEAISTFYSRATLAIEPCQHFATDARDRHEFLTQYAEDYSFCLRGSLQQIRNVHIYSNAQWPIDQEAFHALFLWLIPNTSVSNVWLSRKAMQQWRHIERLVNLDGLWYTTQDTDGKLRVIDVFARRICPRLRIYRSGTGFSDASITLRSLEIQAYSIRSNNAGSQLCLDPENSFFLKDRGCIIKKDLIIRNHDRLVDKKLEDPFMHTAHENGALGLFQSILIHG